MRTEESTDSSPVSAATRFESLVRVSNAIGMHRDPEELFASLVKELHRVVRFDYIAVTIRDEKSNTFHKHSIDAEKIRNLSRFLPVIVLIHKSTIKKLAVRGMTDSKSLTETSESTKLLGLFGQAVNLLETADTNNVVVFGDVIVNFSALEVHRKGRPVVLTALEFKTLNYFIQNARRAISRDELLNEVWGYENYPCTRTVDNHIFKLRQKLERDSSRPVHFRTVHGAGYKFLP